MTIISLFEKLEIFFSSLGFGESKHHDREQYFSFSKISDNLVYNVNFGYQNDNGKPTVDGLIYSSISSESVNRHLEKLDVENSFERIVLLEFPGHEKGFGDPKLAKLNSIEITSKESLLKAVNIIHDHLANFVLPFFQKVPELLAIDENILNKISKEDYSDYIPGKTNFKVLIIMKLCGNPKYEEFKSWALNAYQRGFEMNPDRYGEDLEALKKLVAYLDKEN